MLPGGIGLSPQEFFKPGDFHIGAIHVRSGGGEVAGAEGGMRLGEELTGAIHGFKNVAANHQAVRLLLAAEPLHSREGGTGPGIEFLPALLGLTNLGRRLRRDDRRRWRPGGACSCGRGLFP